MLVAIRLLDLQDAKVYAAALSRYVIGTEVYNLLFPTDPLYKPGATVNDAISLALCRLRVAVPIAAISFIVLTTLSGRPAEAAVVSLCAVLSATAIPLYAFAFPRLSLRRLFRVEVSCHVAAAAALGLWLTTGHLWIVLAFTFLEVPAKGTVVMLSEGAELLRSFRSRREWLEPRSMVRELANGLKTGFPITLSNYFFRLPFAIAFPSGSLDPLFMLCAQAVNSLYNLILVVHSDRLAALIRKCARASLAVAVVGFIMAEGGGFWKVTVVQFMIVSAFTLPYAAWLAALPGKDGLFQSDAYRLLVISVLLSVLLCAALVETSLIWAVFAFPLTYFVLETKRRYVEN